MTTPFSSWLPLLFLLAAIASGAAGVISIYRHRHDRRFCPGRVHSRLLAALPWTWLLRPACWYDLSRGESVICPECGEASTPARRYTLAHRWRPLRLAFFFATLALVFSAAPLTQEDRWARLTPTLALVSIGESDVDLLARPARREIETRVRGGSIHAWSTAPLINALVADLADDGEGWNAARASRLLRNLGDPARAALERALSSPDIQQRQLAASLLRERQDPHPCEELFRVSLESLRDDGRTQHGYRNASSAARLLARHPARARPYLAQGLHSFDYQQVFLCAVLAGMTGAHDLADDAAPILIRHLADNYIPGDARLAAPALYRFGSAAIPHLEPFRDSPDDQQRYLIRQILFYLDAGDPPDPETRQRITSVVRDPITAPFEPLARGWRRLPTAPPPPVN